MRGVLLLNITLALIILDAHTRGVACVAIGEADANEARTNDRQHDRETPPPPLLDCNDGYNTIRRLKREDTEAANDTTDPNETKTAKHKIDDGHETKTVADKLVDDAKTVGNKTGAKDTTKDQTNTATHKKVDDSHETKTVADKLVDDAKTVGNKTGTNTKDPNTTKTVTNKMSGHDKTLANKTIAVDAKTVGTKKAEATTEGHNETKTTTNKMVEDGYDTEAANETKTENTTIEMEDGGDETKTAHNEMVENGNNNKTTMNKKVEGGDDTKTEGNETKTVLHEVVENGSVEKTAVNESKRPDKITAETANDTVSQSEVTQKAANETNEGDVRIKGASETEQDDSKRVKRSNPLSNSEYNEGLKNTNENNDSIIKEYAVPLIIRGGESGTFKRVKKMDPQIKKKGPLIRMSDPLTREYAEPLILGDSENGRFTRTKKDPLMKNDSLMKNREPMIRMSDPLTREYAEPLILEDSEDGAFTRTKKEPVAKNRQPMIRMSDPLTREYVEPVILGDSENETFTRTKDNMNQEESENQPTRTHDDSLILSIAQFDDNIDADDDQQTNIQETINEEVGDTISEQTGIYDDLLIVPRLQETEEIGLEEGLSNRKVRQEPQTKEYPEFLIIPGSKMMGDEEVFERRRWRRKRQVSDRLRRKMESHEKNPEEMRGPVIYVMRRVGDKIICTRETYGGRRRRKRNAKKWKGKKTNKGRKNKKRNNKDGEGHKPLAITREDKKNRKIKKTSLMRRKRSLWDETNDNEPLEDLTMDYMRPQVNRRKRNMDYKRSRSALLETNRKLGEGGDEEAPGRRKRKVISRGGHYIVWSRSGTSPWSSTGHDTYAGTNFGRNYNAQSYSWLPPGGPMVDGVPQGYAGPQGSQKPTERKKLNQSFKREIAQYAIVYGVRKAALHYEKAVGRRLRDRVVEKFVNRYQERKKRKRRRSRRLGRNDRGKEENEGEGEE